MRRLFPAFAPGLLVVLGACGGSSEEGGELADAASDVASDASSGDGHPDDATSDDAPDANADGASDGRTDAGDGGGDAAPAAFDPSTWAPKGKGLWIWYFAYTGLTPAEAAIRAQKDGVGYVLLKSGQDASFWSTRYTADVLKEFTSRGMHVFAWPYVTPADVPGSIDAVVKAIDTPGTDGIVLDVEVEFEGSHGPAAKQLCTGIRAKRPKVWLGFTSFGWPQYHGTFPWSEFDTYCGDAWMPQVYWSDRGVGWSYGYDDALAGIKSVGIKSPVWMIQSNDDIYKGGAPTTADLNSFFDKAGTKTMLWELPAAAATAKLTQLDALHWKNP